MNIYKHAPRMGLVAALVAALWAPLQPASAQVPTSELAADAPSQHVVARGDTLWGISGKFLKSPWKWPQLWALNKSQIRNPHLIYPGQVLKLEIVNGMATLGVGGKGMAGEVRLRPGVRVEEALTQDIAVSTVPLSAVKNFLARPILVDAAQFVDAPRVIIADGGRLFSGAGSRLYASGLAGVSEGDFAVYRQGGALTDPDTGEVLAFEAIHLGTVRMLRGDSQAALMEVLESNQEITDGDRLVPVEPNPSLANPVHAVDTGFAARVIKIHDTKASTLLADSGMSARTFEREGGALSIVALNKGSANGVELGHVVGLVSTGAVVGRTGYLGYRNGDKAKVPVKLPDEPNGTAVVFRVFDKVSYALVMEAKRPVVAGDRVGTP